MRYFPSLSRAAAEELPLLSHLDSSSIDQLWAAALHGPCCVGACLVGDVLTGTALVLLSSDSQLHCFWPPAPQLPVVSHLFAIALDSFCGFICDILSAGSEGEGGRGVVSSRGQGCTNEAAICNATLPGFQFSWTAALTAFKTRHPVHLQLALASAIMQICPSICSSPLEGLRPRFPMSA